MRIAIKLTGLLLASALPLSAQQRTPADRSPLMASLTEELSISSRLVLTRTRGEVPPALVRGDPNTAAEFEVAPATPESAGAYSAVVLKLEGGQASPIGEARTLTISGGGKLRFYVRTEVLSPGDYLLRLADGAGETEEFLFRVAP